jgi:cysteine desulfurase
MKNKRIYCDHNATTPIHKDVKALFKTALDIYGNASSLYLTGRQAKEELEQARETIASFIHANSDQLIFCSSGTEANNHVLNHFIAEKCVSKKPVHILASAIEHSSVLSTLENLKKYAIDYDLIPVDSNGHIKIDALKHLIKPHTKLASIMLANNEIGSIQDIKTLTKLCHEHNILFHCDGVQALGKIPIDVTQLDIDFMSFSAHKIYAPKGCGALYIKDEEVLSNLIHGGHQERGLRASTENIPGIIAFRKAIELLDVNRYSTHTSELCKRLIKKLNSLEPVFFNSSKTGLSNTLNISFPGCDGHALAMNCDLEGLDLSTGSACSVGSVEPSHVLTAIGLSNDLNKSSLRLSFGLSTSLADIDIIAEIIISTVTRLRSL